MEEVPREASEFIRRLKRMHVGGSLSLNWRLIGPEEAGFETQIQHEVLLADMYFGADGPFVDGIPFNIEMHIPTGSQGNPQLNQLNFEYRRIESLRLQFGKFLVPFGRYNELYRPDQFLTVTRPLLYASPDSLDLVVRVNSPRAPLSSGYTDIGARMTYYPPKARFFVPDELTLFVVNGLGESSNRQRTFPDPENLGIPPPPANGVNIDFGHRNNNLADNNNNKAFGGRAVFSMGDVRLPWPIPEGALDLKEMLLGVSGMGGQYNLEADLNYQMYGVDFSFDYFGFNFSGEYLWSFNHFLAPLRASSSTLTSPVVQVRDFEVNQGYFIQTSFPILRRPRWGQRLTGVLVFNQMFRRGPLLDLFLNQTAAGTTFPSLKAIGAQAPRLTRRMEKYTAAANYQLSDHFALKLEYSYWALTRSSTVSGTNPSFTDVYQSAVSMVMGF